MKGKFITIVVSMLMFATIFTVAAHQNTMVTPSYSTASITNSPKTFTPFKPFNLERKMAYAWALSGMTAGPIKFDLASPGAATSIKSSSTQSFAGTWANNKWYIITYPTNNLMTVDTTTGTETLIGNTGVSTSLIVTGIAYRDSTSKMYATWVNPSTFAMSVYEINLNTGVGTKIGADLTTDGFIDIACNKSGQFYGFGLVTDILYKFDPTVPSMTPVGSLGILINYAQGAECDKDTDILYLAGYTTSGALYTVNQQTGLCTLVGAFPSSAEVDAFAIPYSGAPPNQPPVTPGAPTGPTTGSTGVSYSFDATTTDPEGDNISFMFDWGDGNLSSWIGPVASGGIVTASYTWASAGTYGVKVKAKDEYNAESAWSPAHSIVITAEGPILEIGSITGGLLKVKAIIKNTGTTAAANVSWKIELTGGLILLGKSSTGTIATIAAGGQSTVTSKLILGFGKTVVKVTADTATKSVNATVLLVFIKI